MVDKTFSLPNNKIMVKKMMKNYISLGEAAKNCPYSADYLKLRARQGKLKAVKLGRNWFTTKEWLEEYKKTSKQSRFLHEKRFNQWVGLLLIIFILMIGIFILLNFFLPILEKVIPAKVYLIE